MSCAYRFVFRKRITPAQAIAIDEDNPAQHPSVIDPWLAVRLREKGESLAICSSVSQ
jgi:hypothetical protein